MSKTIFVDGNPLSGIEGTIVAAAFLNALNTHRHMGSATDGDGSIDYAADTGSADSVAIAMSPVLTAHVIGMPITIKAKATNTGACTLTINSLSPVAIRKNVNVALEAGDITADCMITVVYDGTYYQLVSSGQGVGLSQFSASLATPGYQQFPTSDKTKKFILQWGHTGAFTTNNEEKVITFPVAFPNACLFAGPLGSVGIPDGSTNTEGMGTKVVTGSPVVSTTSFTVHSGWESGSAGAYWIAGGY